MWWTEDILSGRRRDAAAVVVRAALAALEPVYAAAIAWRNCRYDRGWARVRSASVPVISVGNLTVGGTGKTPMVAWLAERLVGMGRRPGIVSRGYKGGGGANDEMTLLSRLVPQAVCVAHPNRVAAAGLAVRRFGADVIVLDDGFQHRRLARDLDIVLVDATQPFGFDHLLPRGRLREPPRSLARADVVVVTRANLVGSETLALLLTRIGLLAPQALCVRCGIEPAGWKRLGNDAASEPVAALPAGAAERTICFAGLGNPRAFLETVRLAGVEPIGACWWPDHHRYSRRDLASLAVLAREHEATALVTSAKDAVKVEALAFDWPVPVFVLHAGLAITPEDATLLEARVQDVLGAFGQDSHAEAVPSG